MLERLELRRYNRQLILPEIGPEGQEKLKNARVLMIGAGGLGCPVLQYMAAAGVGKIGILDDDLVDLSNLHRQILYTTADIGKPKSLVAKARLDLLNPHLVVHAYFMRLGGENAEDLFEEYDLIIDGSDNFPTRYLVNDTCIALDKVLVSGAIFKFEGTVAVFNFEGGPSYRDLFPEPPAAGEVQNCAEIGVMGVLPGIVGAYMASEVVKLICGFGETLSGKLMTINALDNSTSIFKIRSSSAAGSVSRPKPAAPAPSLQELTKKELESLLNNDGDALFLVDVREEYEFDEFNIGGINVPLSEVLEKSADFPLNKKVIFVCQSGLRSKMAVKLLRATYKGEMYNLKDGFL